VKQRIPQGCIILALFLFLTAGCTPPTKSNLPIIGETPLFRPPTPYMTVTLTPTPADSPAETTPGPPTPTPTCVDNLTFVSDVTIPDGTEVIGNATLDKRWEIKNSGNCNWQEGYRIRLIAGPDMDAQQEQALYPARSGSNAVVRVVFKAPIDAGTYKSAWQAFNPHGEPFGDPFFIEIKVAGEEQNQND
jgi:hypothetical protein